MRKNTLYYLPIFFIIAISNILFNTFFISLLLAGVVFILFVESIKKEYYYMLILAISTFLIIENTHGFKPFLLSFISFFIYFFIIPRIKHILSSNMLREIFYIMIFYIMIFIIHIFSNNFDISSYFVFLINFIIDTIVVGVFI